MDHHELLTGYVLGVISSLTVVAMADWVAVLYKTFTFSKKYTDLEIARIKRTIRWKRVFLLIFTILAPSYLIGIIQQVYNGGLDNAVLDIVIIGGGIILFLVFILYPIKRDLIIIEEHSRRSSPLN